ncbi:MAG TPA: hypothetical protein DCF48_03080 [Rikenellaceae bacterium]|nr:hypothetical protein [Rikenellaceae bacterium]
MLAKDLYLNGIDTVHGNQFEGFVQLHVGRREADGAAHLVSGDHNAVERIGVTQHGIRIRHSPLLQRLPDLRRRNNRRFFASLRMTARMRGTIARGVCDGRRNLVFRKALRKINSFGRGPGRF